MEEPEIPAASPKSAGTSDGSHDIMVVEIPPSKAGAGVGGDYADIPPPSAIPAVTATRQSAIDRGDSTEIAPGTSAAMAVTGKQTTSEDSDSDLTTSRQSATTSQ